MALDIFFLTDITPRYITNKAMGASQTATIIALGPVLQPTLIEQGLNTPLRIQHFLAQVCHETMGLAVLEEAASGEAYERRKDLGNNEPGDGPRFKGRGLFQLTGRANYAAYGAALGLDLIAHPAMAADPVFSLNIACEFWNRHRLNAYADANNLLAVSKIINTGHNGSVAPNGLRDRQDYLDKIRRIWERDKITL